MKALGFFLYALPLSLLSRLRSAEWEILIYES